MDMTQVPIKEDINTYVFMDTETTGLQSPGNNPRITEISLLAYSQGELLTHTKHPRVCHKLILCLDPCRPIQPKSTDITGLHNDALEGMPKFKTQASLIATFLKNLPSPVCLVAHNGNRFDFPLLKAEFKKCCLPEAIDSILCADSLWAFRNFYGLPCVPEQYSNNAQNRSKVEDNAGEGNSSKTEIRHSSHEERNALDSDSDQPHPSHTNSSHSHVSKLETNRDLPESDHKLAASNKEEQKTRTDEVTPIKSQESGEIPNPLKRGSNLISLPDSTAKRRLFATDQEGSVSPSPVSSEVDSCINEKTSSGALLKVKNGKCLTKAITHDRSPPSFSLPTLYRHYFGQEPDLSHTAESDCVTLMKICKLVNCEKFFSWCNKNACPFEDIQPMY